MGKGLWTGCIEGMDTGVHRCEGVHGEVLGGTVAGGMSKETYKQFSGYFGGSYMLPKASIIILVYNGENYMREAIVPEILIDGEKTIWREAKCEGRGICF